MTFTAKSVIATPLIKGVIMAVTLAVLDVPFVKSLILVIVSAVITGMFLIIVTGMNIRETRKNREGIRDVKRKLDANQRETDNPYNESNG